MNTPTTRHRKLPLTPEDPRRLALLCGELNEHIKLIEQRLKVQINQRGYACVVQGDEADAKLAEEVLLRLYEETETANTLAPETVHLVLQANTQRQPPPHPTQSSLLGAPQVR